MYENQYSEDEDESQCDLDKEISIMDRLGPKLSNY